MTYYAGAQGKSSINLRALAAAGNPEPVTNLIGMEERIEQLGTEARNPRTMELDRLEADGLVKVLHYENFVSFEAVSQALPNIAQAVEIITERLQRGGRLFYVGAGTSGRLGVLDASECPPTFGVPPEMVQGIIAGGESALTNSSEGAEDDAEAGKRDLAARGLNEKDAVVGIAASGRTPYVIGALQAAKEVGAAAIALVNNADSAMKAAADLAIEAVTGPEPLTGSTRLKAGTAQKLVLNLLSTAVMVRLGKVYSNLMVDVRASNEKLKNRAERIVMAAANVDRPTAARALSDAGGSAKTAIVMLLLALPAAQARQRLEEASGYVHEAIANRGS